MVFTSAMLVAFLFGVIVGQAWSDWRWREIVRGLDVLNSRLAVIARRLGPWVRRQPARRPDPSDETFAENEIPTKKRGRMTVYIGARAPESGRIRVQRAPTSLFDFSTVTSAELSVSRPDNSRVTWAVTILSQTAISLLLEHVFDVGDLTVAGVYTLLPRLIVPGGVMRGTIVQFKAIDPFKRTP